MLLFPDLPIPPAPPKASRKFAARCAAVVAAAEQLAFRFVLRALERDDVDDPFDFPVHRRATAAEPAPETKAPASIWAFAASVRESAAGRRARFSAAPETGTAKPAAVVRDGGVVRVVGAQYPANRWTDERQEQERARRARQRPPKPTRKAKTRSRKLLDLIGSDEY